MCVCKQELLIYLEHLLKVTYKLVMYHDCTIDISEQKFVSKNEKKKINIKSLTFK